MLGFELLLEGEICEVIINVFYFIEDDILSGLLIQVVIIGYLKVMILLKLEVDIDVFFFDFNVLIVISKQIGCNGFFLFQICSGKNEIDGCMFLFVIGIVEDLVIGNVNGLMGVWLVYYNVLFYDGKVLCVKGYQGCVLGCDGVIEVMVIICDN